MPPSGTDPWSLLNPTGGVSWASLHHGGAVGVHSIEHGGVVNVAEGTAAGHKRLSCVLQNAPATGVARHEDAG
ncbi:urocanate hydratase [Paraburkholderia sp. WSM4179]|nr:urocanate hydratase [Paraburkholderia sp. WSM4179]